MAALRGPEFALLTGVVLGATTRGRVVVLLDGLATIVSALLAVRIEPVAASHLWRVNAAVNAAMSWCSAMPCRKKYLDLLP